MMKNAEITRRQFERMELSDGRLPDGAPILSLFYTTNREYKDWLDVGTTDPLDRQANDQKAMLEIIRERIAQVSLVLSTDIGNTDRQDRATEALAALIKLDEYYRMPDNAAMSLVFSTSRIDVKANRTDPRVRTVDLTQPNESNETDERDNLQEHPDDKVE
jgi:hypothetical protein